MWAPPVECAWLNTDCHIYIYIYTHTHTQTHTIISTVRFLCGDSYVFELFWFWSSEIARYGCFMFVFPFGRPEIASRSFLHFRSKFCRRFWLFQVCFQFVRLEIGSLIVLHFRSEICRRCWLFHVCFSIRPTRNSEQDGSTFQIRIVLSCFVVSCLFFNLSDSK